jgi:hypothetical protein
MRMNTQGLELDNDNRKTHDPAAKSDSSQPNGATMMIRIRACKPNPNPIGSELAGMFPIYLTFLVTSA